MVVPGCGKLTLSFARCNLSAGKYSNLSTHTTYVVLMLLKYDSKYTQILMRCYSNLSTSLFCNKTTLFRSKYSSAKQTST